jgi:hypothetical protein
VRGVGGGGWGVGETGSGVVGQDVDAVCRGADGLIVLQRRGGGQFA